MGNWFSSSPSPPQQTPQPRNDSTYNVIYPSLPYRGLISEEAIINRNWTPPHTFTPSTNRGVSTRREFLLADSKKFSNLGTSILSLNNRMQYNVSKTTKKTLNEFENNFAFAKRLFLKTTHVHFITQIQEVFNPYLMAFYLLRQKEYEILHQSSSVTKEYWFHGTKKQNIDKICMNNFNWRMHGKSKGNIFGKGVSFSPIANYSSNYNDNAPVNVMILSQVLSSNGCTGHKNMTIPMYLNHFSKTRYDTSKKPDGKVCVKYCDDEFYPRFIIHYKQKPGFLGKREEGC